MTNIVARNLAPRVTDLMEHFPAVIIEGARQVGKSTLATHLAAAGTRVLNLDLEEVRSAARADPAGLIQHAEGAMIVIDEIQRMPELTLAIKAAIDADRRPGRFLMTGSSSLLRVRGTADSLAGRAARVRLYGLSQGEIRGHREDAVAAIVADPGQWSGSAPALARDEYVGILATGAYPELQDMPARLRGAWIDSYLEGIVGRDLPELRQQVRPARSMSVLRTFAARPSAELVKAKLAQETSVPTSTISSYVDLLHDVDLVASVPPWTPNIAKREIGRPKSFVVDSAVAMRLARITTGQLEHLQHREMLGALLESFVAAELLRQSTWSDVDYELFHYRDRDGDEVDLVIECEDGSVIGIEVKASSSYIGRQFAGLSRMRDRLGDRFVAGFVLGTADHGYRYADRLYGAPIAALWGEGA